MSLFRKFKKFNKKLQTDQYPQTKPETLTDSLTGDFEIDLQKIKNAFTNSNDVIVREFKIGNIRGSKAAIIYTDGLADSATIQNFILESLMNPENQHLTEPVHPVSIYEWIKNRTLTIGDISEIFDFQSLFTAVLSGNTIVLVKGFHGAISAGTPGWEDRAIAEPASQTVVRGPREGFSENIRVNTALIRRKIKNTNLYCEHQLIGKVSKTAVAVMYIQGIVNDTVLNEVHTRLNQIDIDAILESSYIEELIEDSTFSPFPTIYNTERPDTVAANLLEGRVAILVDGTPFVLVVPSLFIQNFQVAEDFYQRADISSLIRMLRIICFFIALVGPSFYIALTTYHHEMLPTPLAISLAAQREGVPFPAFVEALTMEVTFEILREAGIRMPRAVGQAVSIVGALVLGQAAVEAGFVSASMVIVVSITAISNFVLPAYNLAISIRMLRFGMMFIAASFGLYGITLALIALVLHLNHLKSFGVPYMAPFGPFIKEDQKDALLRFPISTIFSRPKIISQKNMKRQR